MFDIDGPIIFFGVCLATGILLVAAFATAHFAPERFLEGHKRAPTFVVVIAYLVAFELIFTPLRLGIRDFLSPLPYDWGGINEDGDYVPLGESIASIASFGLSVWILAVTYGWVSEKIAAQGLLDEARLAREILEEPRYLDYTIKRWEAELKTLQSGAELGWVSRDSEQFKRRHRLLETAKMWRDHIERQKESAAFYATERLKAPPQHPPDELDELVDSINANDAYLRGATNERPVAPPPRQREADDS